MTIAELRGKLSPQHANDTSEDLLTSDVFGTLRYVGWNKGFEQWLSCAEPAPLSGGPPGSIRELIGNRIESIDLAFWPTLPNGREPDVALLLHGGDLAPVLVVVEVKYMSGMSDIATHDGSNLDGSTGNQLADQVRGLAVASNEAIQHWFQRDLASGLRTRIHLLITGDNMQPTASYAAARRCLSAPLEVLTYWLSWTRLARHLQPKDFPTDPGRAALIEDLLALLHRKGLVPYSGFNTTPWISARSSSPFWREAWWRDLQPTGLLPRATFWGAKFWWSGACQ